ncbi:conserved Plasmodium protein, unknown function [Plasmodium malariae]|uniref:Uncharacterized protein n=1 Tax=Plasmodium malariae TaxID=5858 RepID=A0A1C3KD09_PLAMA|nr:conserved Plasmodium protein, unknown function [Plasmodium malariae]
MIGLTKYFLFLSQNEKKLNVHGMKIPQIIKLLNKNKDIKQVDLDNIHVQIINNINYINPQKITNNIVCNNSRGKEDLKSLKKKIYFNHLLLSEIVNRNNSFPLYESKECTSTNNTEDGTVKFHEHVSSQKVVYGRKKWKMVKSIGDKSSNPSSCSESYSHSYTETCNAYSDGKKKAFLKSASSVRNHFNFEEEKKNKEIFKTFELTKNYTSFVLDNILRHICTYLYNYKILNKINTEETNGNEFVSVLLISNVFHHFFKLKFGYTYIVHFLNGLSLYRIKKDINVFTLNFELIDHYVTETTEGKNNTILEKEYDVSYIIDYLSTYTKGDEYCSTDNNSNCGSSNNRNQSERNKSSATTGEPNLNVYRFEEESKKTIYFVNLKENVLLSYNINDSYLNNFLKIIANKYNVEKISFSNYCLVLHMYSMSNHFVVNLFDSLPLLFLKNKTCTNINTFIILLNSCIFFLKGKSFINTFHSFRVYFHSNECNILIQHKSHIHVLKEKIYSLIEQIINYFLLNKEIMNNNHLLQILEILSFIKYNKILFSYIFNKINNSLCLLDKYQIFYFINSLSNYSIINNDAKNNIYVHTLKNIDQYSNTEIKELEEYLRVKY